MKKFLLLVATAATLATPSKGQSPSWDPATIENFFHSNQNTPQQYIKDWTNRRIDYFLATSVQEADPIVQRCFKAGMVPYGYSAFWCANQGGGGVPQKGLAMDYGRKIGAACVVYLAVNTIQNGEMGTNHEIYYYGWPPTNGRKR